MPSRTPSSARTRADRGPGPRTGNHAPAAAAVDDHQGRQGEGREVDPLTAGTAAAVATGTDKLCSRLQPKALYI